MLHLTCETCNHSAPISDQDYADGRFSLNCECGDTLWIEERLENTCLRCNHPSVDPFCAQCTFDQVMKIVPGGGRQNLIAETEFQHLTR